MGTHLRAKGLVGTRRGDDVLFIFSISYMYNAKSDHFSPKIKPYIHGNKTEMQYHKIGTDSELIYEDGSI